jgi:hypothetical protein
MVRFRDTDPRPLEPPPEKENYLMQEIRQAAEAADLTPEQMDTMVAELERIERARLADYQRTLGGLPINKLRRQ